MEFTVWNAATPIVSWDRHTASGASARDASMPPSKTSVLVMKAENRVTQDGTLLDPVVAVACGNLSSAIRPDSWLLGRTRRLGGKLQVTAFAKSPLHTRERIVYVSVGPAESSIDSHILRQRFLKAARSLIASGKVVSYGNA
ncbi:MAG: hypothetical protein ACREYC_03335 [Gammaproteobacteria bacterium]